MKIECACCGCLVTNGVNGEVSPPPPWGGTETACCYGCDNEAMEGAERMHVAASTEAAQRAGRFDLV